MGQASQQLPAVNKQPKNQFILNDLYGELNKPAGSLLRFTRGITCRRHGIWGGLLGQFPSAKSEDTGP